MDVLRTPHCLALGTGRKMESIESLRKALRKQVARTAGEDGEKYAKQWLSKSAWKFDSVEQGKCTLSQELKKFGGKRPDFIVDPDDGKGFLLIDAKYHNTDNSTTFRLKDSELGKFRALQMYCEKHWPKERFDVVFMVFPKEHDGERFVWVHLSEFDNGESTIIGGDPATSVSLTDRERLWCENA